MSKNLPPLVNRLYASVMYGGLSAICESSPPIARLVVGENPTRWHVTATPPDILEEFVKDGASKWVTLQGDNGASRNPAKSRLCHATVFYTDSDALWEQRQNHDRPTIVAVAFTVGNMIVAGEVQTLGLHEDYTSVALRHDRRERLVALGMLDMERRQFTAAESGTKILESFVSVQSFAVGGRFADVPLQ